MTESGLQSPEFLAENVQSQMRVLTIVIVILAVLFVTLRFFARWRRNVGIGFDDYVIFVSLSFLFVTGGLNLMMIHYGAGKHMSIVPVSNIVAMAKGLIAFECTYVTTVTLTKCSLLLMYCRIFTVPSVKRFALLLGSISIAWCIAIIFVSCFQCTPLEKTWNPTLVGYCIDIRASFIGNAVPNILTDVAILILPMPQVWKLQTTVGQRVSLSVVFLLGSFVVFTSIYRFTTLLPFDPADVTWTSAVPSTWSVIESAVGIISACLPTLGPLLRIIFLRYGLHSGSGSRKAAPSRDGLVTIGGTGDKANKSSRSRQQNFELLDDNMYPVGDLRHPQDSHISVSICHQNPVGGSGHSEDGSGDEVPLHMIKKQTTVGWTESKRS
ncbi:hypothetical protein DL95DRAFT_489589 [Leptodontidium sp. 2 PMI_412]|nr:hypothetical protein DL95DRAFT_489589 [Leptodontidium sp. 2 PMI_412]